MKFKSSFFLLALFVLFGSFRAHAEKTVSYSREIYPIFRHNCIGCHYPGKLKAELDLTSWSAAMKGGKHGAILKAGSPKASRLLEEISGAEPAMPKDGDPLRPEEVTLIERWIKQGAKDDSPPANLSHKPAQPPTYNSLPAITALAYSSDGKTLAVSGFHEVLLHSGDGSKLIDRLLGESARIESLVFSPDGKFLAVAGSMPSLFGEVQIWRVDSDEAKHEQVRSIKVGTDSIFGLSWSPDGERIAVGCSDRTARVLQVKDGKELLKFDNHSDWVFGTAFTLDGKRLVTASRDKSMKLIDAVSGQLVDEINRESEPLLCMARFPSTNLVICGTDQGASRIFKIAERADRAGGGDPNFVKEVERLPGPVHAVACSADGTLVAVGGAGSEVKVFNARDGKKLVTLKGQEGSIYAVAFNSQTNQIATGGFDGKLRIYELSKGNLLQTCDPVPLRVAKAH